MKERVLLIPMLVILTAPVVIAVGCMFLEVWSKTWGDLANGMEPAETDGSAAAAAATAEFSPGVSRSL